MHEHKTAAHEGMGVDFFNSHARGCCTNVHKHEGRTNFACQTTKVCIAPCRFDGTENTGFLVQIRGVPPNAEAIAINSHRHFSRVDALGCYKRIFGLVHQVVRYDRRTAVGYKTAHRSFLHVEVVKIRKQGVLNNQRKAAHTVLFIV